MILGIDVFSGYGTVDWPAARAAGVGFAWVKCTEGNEPARNDTGFSRNVAACKAAGIPVGGYHYAYPLPPAEGHAGRSPEEQAERAFEASGGLGERPGELPHMLDAEWPEPEDAAKWGCTRPQISAWLRAYCEHATKLWGRKPVIYTYPSWWRWLAEGADVSWASEYEVVWADYGWPGEGLPPAGWEPPHWSWQSTWKDWAACQFSAKGSTVRVPGVPVCPVDRDCIRDEATLRRLARLDEVPTEPEMPTVHPWHFTDDDPVVS